MNITFVPAKDAANQAKHGVSLAEAAAIEWESALAWTDRGAERRVISPRKANAREVARYAQA